MSPHAEADPEFSNERPRATPPVAASVVIPAYQAEDLIGGCLDALMAQAPETPAHEILVVDNGSRDDTVGRVKSHPLFRRGVVRLLREERPGSYAARNLGIAEARGNAILFIDADCRPSACWVAALCAELMDPLVLLTGSSIVPATGDGSLVERYSAAEGILSQDATLRRPVGSFLQTASMGVRADDARSIAGFRADLPTGGDADFCLRLQRARQGGIRLASSASVSHVHRTSVRGLWRQFRRYGQGDVLLWRLHGGSPVRAVLKGGIESLRVLLAPLLSVLRVPESLMTRDILPAATPLLTAVRTLARWAGRLRALVHPGALHRS